MKVLADREHEARGFPSKVRMIWRVLAMQISFCQGFDDPQAPSWEFVSSWGRLKIRARVACFSVPL